MGFLGAFFNKDLAKHLGTNLAPRPLSFSLVYYSNASPKNVWYDSTRWASGAANEPLTFWHEGKKFILIEEAVTQEVGYSNRLDNAYWINSALASLTGDPSPSGSTTDTCKVTTAGVLLEQVRVYKGFALSTSTVSFFIKRGTQGIYASYDYDPGAGDPTNINPVPTTWTRYQKVKGIPGGNYFGIYNCLETVSQVNQATGDNIYWWGLQVELSQLYAHQPIMNATGASLVKSKDEAYWAEADIPDWAREGIRCYVLAVDYSSVQLAADGGSHVIWCCNSTVETITLSISGADNKPRLVGSVSGTIILGDALTFSLGQKLCFDVVFNNGSNSVLIVSCATTGNGTFTGVTTAAADGDIYIGMTPAGGLHLDGAVSQLEPTT